MNDSTGRTLRELAQSAERRWHVPTAIQPHGVLFACRIDDLSVLQVSANVGDYFGVLPEQVIGRELGEFLDHDDAACLARSEDDEPLRVYAADRRVFEAIAHRSDGTLIVEVEPRPMNDDVSRSISESGASSKLLAHGGDARELSTAAAEEIRRLTGFDRVVIHRSGPGPSRGFAAESKRADLPTLPDLLAWPELVDAPSGVRFVADVTHGRAALVPPANPATGAPLDLRRCVLAALSPTAVDQLRSLGVTAAMSLSLGVDGVHMGVVTCHHYSGPRRISLVTRTAAERLSRMLSWQLRVLETAEKRAEEHAAELRSMNAHLLDADLASDEFIATISHELRNPLNVITGWTAMLKAGTLSPEQRERAIHVIEQNVRVQRKLVDDLIDVSKINRGKLVLELETLNLSALLEDALQAWSPAIQAKTLVLDQELAPDLPSIRGDADRIRQVLGNLMTNAIKFTPSGGRIHVRTRAVKSEIELSVSDTGAGIPESFLPHVFESFRQAGSTRERSLGLGLGLSVVKHLVELHGGTIIAESGGRGLGANFRVLLPIAPSSLQSAPT